MATPPLMPGAHAFGPTVTILFSDIRGFTDYTSQHGDAAAFEILRQHDAVVRKHLATFGGHVVKTQGDSFMVSFAAARGAILCAVAIQRALVPADESLRKTSIGVGIGITTGEPIQQDGDFFGTSVNLAARLCAAAGPGQILVAESTRHVAGRIDDVPYLDRGFRELKGFPETQRLFEVVWDPAAAAAHAAGHAPAAASPVAVDPRVERVRWWAGLYAGWAEWKASEMGQGYALRAVFARHPHLLAVPVTESAEHDEGRLAAGYFGLLDHVESQSPGFAAGAVDLAVRAAGGAADPPAVGAQLYELLVTKGRLAQTYQDFVKDVMTIVSRAGVWVDGAVSESDEATVVMRRPTAAIAEPREETRTLTDPAERAAEQRFAITVRPLTTRFVSLKAAVLKTTPRDVTVRLTCGGEPSDHAWYLTLRIEQVLQPSTKRLGTDGVTLRAVGRDVGEVWIGVFNPDPHAATTYEVALTLAMPAAGAQRLTSGRPSPFRAPRR